MTPPRPRPRPRVGPRARSGALRASAAALGLLLVLAACGSEAQDEEPDGPSDGLDIDVSGEIGSPPEVEVGAPLELDESQVWTLEEGEGDPVTTAATTLVHFSIINGETGEEATSTYERGELPTQLVLPGEIFPVVAEALVGVPADSRVVAALEPEDAYGEQGSPQLEIGADVPVVLVVDVISTDPTDVLAAPEGEDVEPAEQAPGLLESDGVPTGFEFPEGDPPTELQAYTLVEGDGAPMQAADRMTGDYLGSVWGSEEVFDASYPRGETATFSVGVGQVIPGWDEALVGVTEGSRVLLVIPPDLAYGETERDGIPADSTLVFVVDVLGVGSG